MNKHILNLLVALTLLAAGQVSFAAETNSVADELKVLVGKVQSKLTQSKGAEVDLTENLKEIDALYARHKSDPNNAAAQILLFKVNVYLQALNDPEHAVEVLKQIKRDFPGLQVGNGTDEAIKSVQRQADAKKLQASLVAGAKFLDFNEKDLTGKPLSVANFKGKVVMIDFWATWCGPCMAELPNVQKIYGKYHDKGFEIIGVSLDVAESKQRLPQFLKDRNMTWPQYFDGLRWDNKLAVKYGVQAIPATFLLDRDGKIIAQGLRGDELEAAVAKALNLK